MAQALASPLRPFLAAGGGDTIDRILDAVRAHLGLEIAFASRFVGDGTRQLTHVRCDFELPMGPGFVEPQEHSYCYHVLEGRLPQLIHDPADFPLAQELAITKLLPVGAHLNVPLRLSDGTLYGSFCCLSRAPDRSMTERDLNVVRAFADLAVVEIETSIERDGRATALHDAVGEVLAGDRLTIVHQPIHALADGRPLGVECLARFADADSRSPDNWFNEAFEIGLGVELELLALRAGLATLPFVPGDLYVSLNASPDTVLSGALDALVERAPAGRLLIELTEHNRIEDYPALRRAIDRLHGKVRIAIDDVGAGYAGLRHIVDLAPDVLKLDMSLTRDIDRDPARRALAHALVLFASEIGATIVAEGIETPAERDTLLAIGVTAGQGYLFSRPMPVVAAQQLLLGRQEPEARRRAKPTAARLRA